MFINRPRISLFSSDFLKSINIIPFKSIIRYLVSPVNISIKIMNILGNLVAFVPLSFLLMLKDKKYYKLTSQFICLGMTVLMIELLQLITSAGKFDIDAFIFIAFVDIIMLVKMLTVKLELGQTFNKNKDIYVGNKNVRYNACFCKNDDKS